MATPPGMRRVTVDGEDRLATSGPAVGDEPTVDGWRVWSAGRSKLAAMLEVGLSVPIDEDTVVLYLGAAGGTTVSHLADVCARVYAVEFAPRPATRLLAVAQNRPAVVPLLKDARHPETYAHVVEAGCDLLVQDLATPNQAAIAVDHRPFLADDGRLVLSIKAPSEDVTADPETVFDDALSTLEAAYEVIDHARLEPYHDDHLGVVATPR